MTTRPHRNYIDLNISIFFRMIIIIITIMTSIGPTSLEITYRGRSIQTS